MGHMVNILELGIPVLIKLPMHTYQDFIKMLGLGKEFYREK